MNRSIRLTAVAGLVLLAGCTRTSGSAPAAHTAPPSAPASTAQNKVAAEADAGRMMAAFPAPPGAVQLARQPAGAEEMARLEYALVTPDLVTRTEWWRVDGTAPWVALLWVNSHAPAGTTTQDMGTATDVHTVTTSGIDWPDTGQLVGRQLLVSVEQAGHDTLIRARAEVAYLPVRPPDSLIPPTATAVSIKMTPWGMLPGNQPPHHYGPAEVTDPARAAKVVALVNALPTYLSGPRSCPAEFPDRGTMSITFTAGADGPTVALVSLDLSNCVGAGVAVTDGSTAELWADTGTADQIIALLGLPWSAQ